MILRMKLTVLFVVAALLSVQAFGCMFFECLSCLLLGAGFFSGLKFLLRIVLLRFFAS